jgi:predicted nuclease of predicted toxin-antitoxin system
VAKFLVDEDLPRSLARELRLAGIDAVDARDAGLRGRPDGETDDEIEQAIVIVEPGRIRLRRRPSPHE